MKIVKKSQKTPQNRAKSAKNCTKWLVSFQKSWKFVQIERYNPRIYMFSTNLLADDAKIAVESYDLDKDIALMRYEQQVGCKILGGVTIKGTDLS